MLQFMRKMTFVACAAVLTSAVALTGCKGGQNEPQQQKKAEVVKTEFAISLPAQSSPKGVIRRMPSANVPEDGIFLGMKNITLIPFAKSGVIASSDVRLGTENIALTDIPAGFTAAGHLTTTGNAKVYSGVAIPLTTASFLVYAESSNAATSGSNDAGKHQNGYLVATGIDAGDPSGITFDLAKVLGTTTLSQIYSGTEATNLIALLNAVANATDGTKPWKDYTVGDDAGMVAIWNTYKTMHALSSFEVKRVLSDLYNSVHPLASTGDKVGTLATNIKTAIETGLNVSSGAGTDADPFVLTWKANYDGYPANLNLPEGSVRIKLTDNANPFAPCEASDYANQTVPTSFVYPASLWYYVNSRIKTANKSMASQYVDGKAWSDILAAYTTESKPTVVSTETRSVAIENQIQYAVGRLDMQVKLASTTLKDNADQDVTAAVGGFPVTAIFIGNQRQLNFDFTPVTSGDLYTIYDNELSDIKAGSGYSDVNSTFVLETPSTGGTVADPNADVQIALELTNNSTTGDFMGANGQLIPAGGKFYLVATLSAKDATEGTVGKRVFRQDVKTIAKLNIGSLANAYNEIPDLRTPKLELGMSVDLTWQAGHTYEITIP